MKNTRFMVVLFSIIYSSTLALSQTPSKFLFIKFSDKAGEGYFYKQWFSNDLNYYTFLNVTKYKEITVEADGKYIKTNDTVKYAKEFEVWNKSLEVSESSIKQPINYRKNSENISYRNFWDKAGKKYLVIDTLRPMGDWVILPDTLRILGFTCQKAETDFYGTKYTAYFTTELAYSGGPRNFRGLPGMILKVESASRKIGYTALEIQFPSNVPAPFFDMEAKKVSKKEADAIAEQDNKQSMMQLQNFQNTLPAKNN